MKNFITLTIIGLVLTACNQKLKDKHVLNVQSVLNEYKDSVPDYGIVALLDNGNHIDTGSIGYSFEKNPISTKNRFCIGSCTKMFTAITVLKLQEKGL